MFNLTLVFLLLSLMTCWNLNRADVFEVCGDKKNVYLSTNESCSKYIFCDAEESTIGECEEDTPYFSEIDQTCDADESVCKLGGDSTTTVSSSSTTTIDPESSPPTTSAESSSTNSTVSELVTGSTTTLGSTSTTAVSRPSSSATTTSSSTIPSTASTAFPISTTTSNHISSQCPATDDPDHIVFIPDTKSCSGYFMCYHGEPMAMHCSNNLHFDPKTLKCDYPEMVQCQLDSSTPREKCQWHTVDVYPYPHNCNYFYSCRLGYLMVMQCPLNMNWDYEKKACRLRSSAKCYRPSGDREIK